MILYVFCVKIINSNHGSNYTLFASLIGFHSSDLKSFNWYFDLCIKCTFKNFCWICQLTDYFYFIAIITLTFFSYDVFVIFLQNENVGNLICGKIGYWVEIYHCFLMYYVSTTWFFVSFCCIDHDRSCFILPCHYRIWEYF